METVATVAPAGALTPQIDTLIQVHRDNCGVDFPLHCSLHPQLVAVMETRDLASKWINKQRTFLNNILILCQWLGASGPVPTHTQEDDGGVLLLRWAATGVRNGDELPPILLSTGLGSESQVQPSPVHQEKSRLLSSSM